MSSSSLDVTTSANGRILYDASRVLAPSDSLFLPDTYPHACPVSEAGRGAAWFVSLDSTDAVLRHYRRGGLIARLSRDRYVWTGVAATRSFVEYRALVHLHEQGCRVPRPLAATWWRHGLTYQAAILVERLRDVQSLSRYVNRGSALPAPAVARAVCQAIHAMHEAGVWHADLNAHNILIDPSGHVWLIDFDRAKIGAVSRRQRGNNLQRLRRSLIKVAGERGVSFYNLIVENTDS
ncbi:MAG TPA: 3-deoxy-D-manno-octulosonic acid kinase [Burkholderiaceae bacterium]|nr:3-deoxy-D-manno-octulosonic acid kinase [Burkholderiaceae bacterium]